MSDFTKTIRARDGPLTGKRVTIPSGARTGDATCERRPTCSARGWSIDRRRSGVPNGTGSGPNTKSPSGAPTSASASQASGHSAPLGSRQRPAPVLTTLCQGSATRPLPKSGGATSVPARSWPPSQPVGGHRERKQWLSQVRRRNDSWVRGGPQHGRGDRLVCGSQAGGNPYALGRRASESPAITSISSLTFRCVACGFP